MTPTKPRIGRPPVPPAERTVQASIALRRKDLEALRSIALERGVSVSRIVQVALARWFEADVRR